MTRLQKSICALRSLTLAMMLFTFGAPFALADLQVYPTRLLFEGGERSGQLHLKHFGTKPTRYRISMVYFQMGPAGELKALENPKQADGFAGDMLRYSPRMVTLNPSEEQVVRVQLRKPADLPIGEYRAHIQFETFDEDDAVDMGKSTDAASGVSMALKAHRAVAIPLIVRNGELSASLSLKDPVIEHLSKDSKIINFKAQLDRDGNRSIYGDLALTLVTEGAEPKVVKQMKGISLYNASRTLALPIEALPAIPARSKLLVTFTDTDKNVSTPATPVLVKE